MTQPTYSGSTSDEDDDGLGCARGVVNSLPFALAFWAVIGVIYWLIFA